MLTVDAINFAYAERLLLKCLSFSVPAGCLVHVKGVNGSGKSTLLKLLAGLLTPLSGNIIFSGTRCYVGHKAGVHHLLTAREHWQFDLIPEETGRPTLPTVLQHLGLTGAEDTPYYLLSAGQQRRMSFMRLFARTAPLWLLDEPLINLDNAGVDALCGLTEQHLAHHGLVVMTSHQALPFTPRNQQVVQL